MQTSRLFTVTKRLGVVQSGCSVIRLWCNQAVVQSERSGLCSEGKSSGVKIAGLVMRGIQRSTRSGVRSEGDYNKVNIAGFTLKGI